MKPATHNSIAPTQPEGVAPAVGDATTAMAAHIEWLLDESLAETFPASDPIAPARSPKPNDACIN